MASNYFLLLLKNIKNEVSFILKAHLGETENCKKLINFIPNNFDISAEVKTAAIWFFVFFVLFWSKFL